MSIERKTRYRLLEKAIEKEVERHTSKIAFLKSGFCLCSLVNGVTIDNKPGMFK